MSIQILVVEDNALIGMEVESLLEESGFSVTVEASGEAAIETLEKDHTIRALVTDINLQKTLRGWDVARRARELHADLPVIYVTSVAEDEWASQGVPKSILISKPFVSAQVITALSQLLNTEG